MAADLCRHACRDSLSGFGGSRSRFGGFPLLDNTDVIYSFMSFNSLYNIHYIDPDTWSLLTPSQALVNARFRWILDDNDRWVPSELSVCSHPIYNPRHFVQLFDRPVSSVRRLPDEDYTADDLERSKRRARHAVRDYMDCNRFEYFMTFTLNADRIRRDDYGAFVKAVGKYMNNRVTRFGWCYVAVPEYHHDQKSLHLHAVVVGDQYRLADSGTVLIPGHKKPVKRDTARRYGVPPEQWKTVYNVTDWKYGYSTAIKVYGGRKTLTNYIMKYITKSETKIGGRWYYQGGKLRTPLYTYDDIDFESLTADYEFSNAGGDFKIVRLDENTCFSALGDLQHCNGGNC